MLLILMVMLVVHVFSLSSLENKLKKILIKKNFFWLHCAAYGILVP